MTEDRTQAANPAAAPSASCPAPLAKPGEFSPLQIGPLSVWPPVVLAPMAGVTNAPFRTLCREFGAGLFVSEMITARGLVEENARTVHLAGFAPGERPRSLQLYSVDPGYLGRAVASLRERESVDHIDLNFGCPVKKVTRRGGGAAIPWKRALFRDLVRAAVRNAGELPVTVKFRMGIDESHLTFLDAGRIAENEGCAAVALHARTAAQLYDGGADWRAIAALREAVVGIPVLGNGDIWEAGDALRMMRQTGCDGVVVGRGCLGRPWLFRDLDDVFAGHAQSEPPALSEVFGILQRHAALLVDWFGEAHGIRSARKHAAWYTKGFRDSARLRDAMMRMESLAELDAIVAGVEHDEPFPAAAARIPRGKRAGTQRVVLPTGWLDHRDDPRPAGALREEAVSGG